MFEYFSKILQEIYMLFTGWEVDRPKPVNNIFIFFLLRLLGTAVVQKFQENLPSLFNLCVEVGRVHVDEARDRSQTKQMTQHFLVITGQYQFFQPFLNSLKKSCTTD